MSANINEDFLTISRHSDHNYSRVDPDKDTLSLTHVDDDGLPIFTSIHAKDIPRSSHHSRNSSSSVHLEFNEGVKQISEDGSDEEFSPFFNTVFLITDEIFFSGNMPNITEYFMNESNNLFESNVTNFLYSNSYHETYLIAVTILKNLPFFTAMMLNIVLRGVSQVYLCNNPLTGLLICIGFLLTSYKLLVFCLLSTASATLGAYLFVVPHKEELFAGLCGYDGTLVGGAAYTFLALTNNNSADIDNKVMLIATALSFFAGIIHMACVNMNKLPALTLAFNIITCSFLLAIARNKIGSSELQSGNSNIVDHEFNFSFFMDAMFRGVGQFAFVSTTLGGVFVFLGIFFTSRAACMCALLGSGIGCLVASYIFGLHDDSGAAIRNGLFSYNPMGTAVAIGGGVFYHLSWKAIFAAVVGACLCILLESGITSLMDIDSLALPALTMPFVFATWLVMLTRTELLAPLSEGEDADLDEALYMERKRQPDDGTWTFRRKVKFRRQKSISSKEIYKILESFSNKNSSKKFDEIEFS